MKTNIANLIDYTDTNSVTMGILLDNPVIHHEDDSIEVITSIIHTLITEKDNEDDFEVRRFVIRLKKAIGGIYLPPRELGKVMNKVLKELLK